MKSTGAKWIWFPHDFEIYHAMKQNFEREERGFRWPAYWKTDGWNHNVRFFGTVSVPQTELITLHVHGTGYLELDGEKRVLTGPVRLEKGEHTLRVILGSMTELPCLMISGHHVQTDESWLADNYEETLPAGTSPLYTSPRQNPNIFRCPVERREPVSSAEKAGGLLLDYGRECYGSLELTVFREERHTHGVTIQYGESEAEAMDRKWCYHSQKNVRRSSQIPARAFRYLFIPGARTGDLTITALHEVFPVEQKAAFSCDDTQLTQIWHTAAETFRLCSGLFFIDGIKRDRWIWSGDAYQSYLVNRYLFFDPEIDKRTIRALRGAQGSRQHINTIVDYTMLWLISLENEYMSTGDLSFVREMYPKAEKTAELLLSQTQEQGFLYGRERDWIYIDWADMDKTGCLCAEQILLWKALKTMAFLTELTDTGTRDASWYRQRAEALKDNILQYYWDEEKGAFIDSYASGKRNVTRHANIFALLFDFADEERAEAIVQKVLLNDRIPAITTPYFRFFELDVLAKCGYLKEVMEILRSYWGGMLERGAVTFWEEFNPAQDEKDQYGMYGDPFGKSLCHAWAASPIYLIGRWFLGVRPLEAGYRTFEVSPQLAFFDSLDCTVPVKDGCVSIRYAEGVLEVTADRSGGTLLYGDSRREIPNR